MNSATQLVVVAAVMMMMVVEAIMVMMTMHNWNNSIKPVLFS